MLTPLDRSNDGTKNTSGPTFPVLGAPVVQDAGMVGITGSTTMHNQGKVDTPVERKPRTVEPSGPRPLPTVAIPAPKRPPLAPLPVKVEPARAPILAQPVQPQPATTLQRQPVLSR